MLYFFSRMAALGSFRMRWQSLTVEQKLAVGVLGVAGVTALVFGLVQVRSSLIRPFTTDVQTLVELKKQSGPTEAELAEQAKTRDTDGDGVSDFDETNVYQTSPYVRDSDSDGEPDNIEIAKGTDPRCARGKTCLSTSETAGVSSTAPVFAMPPQVGVGVPDPTTGAMQGVPPRDAKAIRAYLQSNGWSAADLAQFTDAQILEAYDQSAEPAGASDPSADADLGL
jgi:hypothetical protein